VLAKRLATVTTAYWQSHVRLANDKVARDLDSHLLALLQSDIKNERLSGIAAITALINSPNETNSARISRTTLALTILENDVVPKHADDIDTAEETAALVATFSRTRGVASSEVIDVMLSRAIRKLLQAPPGKCSRKSLGTVHSAILVKALAQKNSRLILDNVRLITAALCELTRDRIPAVRAAGVAALSAILEACADEVPNNPPWPTQPYLEIALSTIICELDAQLEPLVVPAFAGSSISSRCAHAIVGSLAIIRSLLANAATRLLLLAPPSPQNGNIDIYGTKFASCVSALMQAQSPTIHHAVADLLPALASADPVRFCSDGFLDKSYAFLASSAEDSSASLRERTYAVVSLGRIAENVGEDLFAGYLDRALRFSSSLLRKRAIFVESGVGSGADGRVCKQLRAPIFPPSVALDFVHTLAETSSVGNPCFVKHVRNGLLAMMLHTGCSRSLFSVLKRVAAVIPELEQQIQEGLLQNAAAVLKPYSVQHTANTPAELLFVVQTPENMTPGFASALDEACAERSESRIVLTATGCMCEDFEIMMHADDEICFPEDIGNTNDADTSDLGLDSRCSGSDDSCPRTDSTIIALNALTTYEFSVLPESRLVSFANDHIVGYFESVSVRVRRLAAQACAAVTLSPAEQCVRKHEQTSVAEHLRGEVFCILLHLTSIAAVDPSRCVRLTALKSLENPTFTSFLAQPEALSHLSACLHDEDFSVRTKAISLISSVKIKNGVTVRSSLHTLALDIMTILRCSTATFTKVRAQAARLMQIVTQDYIEIVDSCGEKIVAVLIACLEEQLEYLDEMDASVAIPILHAVADIAESVDVNLKPHANVIVPLLIDAVLDVDTSDAEFGVASLRALTRVVQNTEHVIKPYEFSPYLLPHILTLIRPGPDVALRLQAVILLGVIGAVNPDCKEFRYAALNSFAPMGSRSTRADALCTQDIEALVTDIWRHCGPGHDATYAFGGSACAEEVGIQGMTAATSFPHQQRRQHMQNTAVGHETRQYKKPQLFANGPEGVDFAWIHQELRCEVPVCAQPSLRMESLASCLGSSPAGSKRFFISAVLSALHKTTLSARCTQQQVDAVTGIVRLLQVIKGIEEYAYYLPTIVPPILWILRPMCQTGKTTPLSSNRGVILSCLTAIVDIVGDEYAPYVTSTVSLCHKYLTHVEAGYRHSAVRPIMNLLIMLRSVRGNDFRPYVAYMLDPSIRALIADRSERREATSAVLDAIRAFGFLLMQHASIVFPALTLVMEDISAPLHIRQQAIVTLTHAIHDMSPIGSRISSIIHPLVRVLAEADRFSDIGRDDMLQLGPYAAASLSELARITPQTFLVFVPTVAQALLRSGLSCTNGERMALEAQLGGANAEATAAILSLGAGVPCGTVVEPIFVTDFEGETDRILCQAPLRADDLRALRIHDPYTTDSTVLLAEFSVNLNSSAVQWTRWIDALSETLFWMSHAPEIRSVAFVCERHPELSRELFNVAFLSCWETLSDRDSQQTIADALHAILKAPHLPIYVGHIILDVLKFMKDAGRALPVPTELQKY
jgi:hypothetical protein